MKLFSKTFASIFISVLLIPVFVLSQNSEVNKLFDKYSGEEGFTSVDVSAGLFELFAEIEFEVAEYGRSEVVVPS